MRAAGLITLLMLLGWIAPAQASIGPTFLLESCAWDATDIVVVTSPKLAAGTAEVLETWKGDVRRGDVLAIPELAAFASEEARTVVQSPRFGQQQTGSPVVVTGARIVLFLKKDPEAPGKWLPASIFGDMRVAMVWMPGVKAYSFQQWMRPGPTELREMALSSADVRDNAEAILKTQHDLSEAASIASPGQRARALAPFAREKYFRARQDALADLAGCGDAALPVLEALLGSREGPLRGDEIVQAIEKIGGAPATEEMVQIVRTETSYWKRTAPKLLPGWWNWNGPGLNESQREVVQDHCAVTNAAVYALLEMDYRGDMDAIRELRDYWSSLPQLNDKGGLDEVVTYCDRMLKSN